MQEKWKFKKKKKKKKKKKMKITKWANAFKGYSSSFSVEILNSFDPELQLKDTECEVKKNLNILFTEFRFVTTVLLVLKKIESEDKTKYDTFYSCFKQILMKLTLMTYLNQSILQLYQAYKHLKEKDQARLLIQSWSIMFLFQSIIP